MNRFSSTDAYPFDPLGAQPRIIELIRTAHWDWRVEDDTESLGEGFAELFGLTTQDLPTHPRAWRKFLDPADAARMEESFRKHVESRGAVPFREEARYVHADGSSIWIICNGQVIDWSTEGEPLRMTGTHTEVSALRRQKLRHELLSLVAAHTIHAVVITDDSGCIQWINRSFTNITGYSLDEVRGKRPGQVLQGPGSDLAAVGRIRQAIAGGCSCEETLTNYTKAGIPYTVHIKIDPVRDGSGRITHFIAVQTDVTEQVKAQSALEQSEVRLRAVLDSATGVALIATDREGIITYFSRGAEALLGYTSEEVVGRCTPEVIHDPAEIATHSGLLASGKGITVSGFPAVVAMAEKLGADRREWTYLCKDGSRKAVELNVTVVRDERGEVQSYLGTATDITQRKHMERDLRRSEEQFRGMFELSPVGISFNAMNGAFLDMNRALLDSLGYTREQLTQMTYWDLTPREYEEKEHAQLKIMRETGQYGPYEKEFFHRDGHRVPAQLHGVLLGNSDGEPIICSIVQDITETKRREQELRLAVEAQKAAYILLEAAGRLGRVGHWEWTILSKTMYWSDLTYEIIEASPSTELSRESLVQLVVESDRERVTTALGDTVRAGSKLDIETQIVTPSGRTKWIHCMAEAVRSDTGRITSLRGVLQDIDERRRAADLLEQRNRELEIATARAEAHARAKEEFLANVSHEIRTPLNAVIGMSELLSGANLLPHERELVETIHSSGNTLLALINDILDFSKIESGQLDLETIKVDLRDCLESAMEVMATTAAHKKLDLVCRVHPDVPQWIKGDPTRLRQVFVNLLSNAVKFTTRGEVVATLDISHDAAGRMWIQGSVLDTGIGIPTHRMEKLFQAFSQVDASTTRRYGGTGLGLVICHRLLEKMGGRIWVDSEFGHGSVFHFEIPAMAVNSPPRGIVETHSLQGRRILIADDNAASREIYRALAEEECGMSSVVATTAEDTLGALHTGGHFDIIQVDSSMRTPDGEPIVTAIRTLRKHTPIVALSPMDGSQITMGSPDHLVVLSRPVRRATLLSTMVRMLTGPSEHRGERRSENRETAQGNLCPLKILVAEDNPVNQRVVQLMLNRIGYEATIVCNGIEVLQALDKLPFDVVLLDVQMPEMDGLQAAREIRKRRTSAFHPWLVALTANAEETDRTACLEAGMDDYLSKPVGLDTLKAALGRAFRARAETTGIPAQP